MKTITTINTITNKTHNKQPIAIHADAKALALEIIKEPKQDKHIL